MNPREKAILALSRVEEPGVSVRICTEAPSDGASVEFFYEQFESCPKPDLALIRANPIVWAQFIERVAELRKEGESPLYATRRSYLELRGEL